MNQIAVRLAHYADLEPLSVLFDAYRQFYGRESDIPAAGNFLRDRWRRRESVIFVAGRDGLLIGFTQLFPSFSSVALAPVWILNDLFVDSVARHQGAGTGLLRAAVDYAREQGAVRLTLSTAVANQTAQALYQAEGWRRDEQFIVYHYLMAT